MRINFRQGLVSSETDGSGQPNFLTGNGTGITLRTSNRPVVFSLASGAKNYTISFYSDVLAWPVDMFAGITEAWLYIDVNRASSARRYGLSTAAPSYGPTAPTAPVNDQLWFDTTTNTMKAYNLSALAWFATLRVVAGHYTTTDLSCVPFGTQIGINGQSVVSGSIVVDGFGVALKDSYGNFITTEDILLVDGAPSYAAKLESNVTVVPAGETLAAFHVIKYQNDGKAVPASYDDVGSNIIGITTTTANANDPVDIVLAGKVHNPMWNWESANVTLWVGENGELIAIDPFTQGGHAKSRVPVARTLNSNTIIFDQGLGGVGEKGEPGDIAGIVNASDLVKGVSKLSVPPTDAADPIAVGINDPILTSPKVPIEHTHTAISVTVSPFGTFNGNNAQQALEFLQTNKLGLSGGTVIGNISSSTPATLDAHLITLGQTNSLLASSAVTYKRFTLSSSELSIVPAFNLLTDVQRTLISNVVVVLEWKTGIYLWTGGAGAPVLAEAENQFLLVGKSSLDNQVIVPTIRTLRGYACYEPASYSTNVETLGSSLIKIRLVNWFNTQTAEERTIPPGQTYIIKVTAVETTTGLPTFAITTDPTTNDPSRVYIGDATYMWIGQTGSPATAVLSSFFELSKTIDPTIV